MPHISHLEKSLGNDKRQTFILFRKNLLVQKKVISGGRKREVNERKAEIIEEGGMKSLRVLRLNWTWDSGVTWKILSGEIKKQNSKVEFLVFTYKHTSAVV